MPEWSFSVTPDLTVTLRAPQRPPLLARALGSEIEGEPNPALVLDLGGKIHSSAPSQRGRYKTFPWRLQIRTLAGKQTVVFRSPLFREYLALHIALLSALRDLLLDRDSALVTGAACASKSGATLLAGRTGRGKTAALLAAAARGAQLIGDEYVSVSASGEIIPFLRVLALRRGALAAAPELAQRLSGRRQAALLVAALALRISRGRLDPLVHMSPAELGLASAQDRAFPLSTLLWLDSAAPPDPSPMSTKDAVDALMGVSQAHDRLYGVHMGSNEARWRETLSRGLSRVRCLRAGAPLAPGVLDSVMNLASPGVVVEPAP